MTYLASVAHCLPQNEVTNADLAKFMNTSDEWIQTRSGIKTRRWVRDGNKPGKGMGNYELVARASETALKEAGIKPEEIDLICYATISADNEMPGSGALLQQEICPGRRVPIFEIRNQCSGFIYALQTARAFIENKSAKNALVIGAEIQSTGLDLSDAGRNTAVLFADGAGTAVLTANPGPVSHKILSLVLHSDGKHSDKLGIKYPGFRREVNLCAADFSDQGVYPSMDGKFVFKAASICMPQVVREIVSGAGYEIGALKAVIPHQANQRIIEMLAHDLGSSVKVFSNIGSYGNTTAASIPIALSEASKSDFIIAGDLVCLVSFGAGFSWGAALIKW